MPGSNNDYIQNEFWKEEVEIVDMDGSNITKTHTRTLEMTRALEQPTLLLSKKGKVRERLQFINVYEIEISRPSNLIQLVCSNEEIVTLRVKSRASLERWLDHLRKSLPMDSRGNSSDHFRGRAATENHKLRGRHSRTPRDNAEVQSVHYPERTIISPPTNAQNLMEPLAEDDYEIPFASLRSNNVYPRSTDQQPICQGGAPTSNHGNSDLHAVVSFEIKIGSTKKPQPPPKPDSHRRCHPPNGNDANQGSVATCGWNTSNRGICLPNKELVNELRSVVSNKSANSGDKHTPSIRANRPSYRPRPAMRLPIEETTDEDYDTLAAPCVSNGNAAADRRQASRRAPEDRLRIKPASEDQEPSSSSSSDESDESLYKNVGNSIYLERSTLSSEMDKESICVEVEKSKLLNLKIKTTSAGPCISKVPPGLLRKLYLGDRILDINEQMITNTDFAYSIIKTSKNDMVKVTVKRLIRGYFVDLHRRNPEEGLGFSLTDGPVIASVSPGTDFARKANCAMMEKMVITHVNGQYIPFNSETRQVNMTIRDAGSRFFVILQPLDFMTELTGSAHRT